MFMSKVFCKVSNNISKDKNNMDHSRENMYYKVRFEKKILTKNPWLAISWN